MAGAPFRLDADQRRTLAALCHTVVPAAATTQTPVDLPAHIEERVATFDRFRRREFRFLLTVADSRLASLLFTGRPARFTRLEPGQRTECLAAWERSRLPLRRTMFQALRRLILSTYYALEESWEAIGYRGPLHTRAPAVDWEGPLRTEVPEKGPVAVEGDAVLRPSALHRLPSPSIARGGVDRAEVVVIGSGAGGAVAAARLAEAGKDVVILEAGGHWTSETFDEVEATQYPRLYAEAANRSTDDLSMSIFQGACVGGGTTVNWMITLRTPDWVLNEWTAEHGVEGMTPAEMEPVFARVEEEIHVKRVPDAAHNPNNRIILDGARALGWKAQAARINAKDCVRAGFCGIGCRYGAKQSGLQTYLPRAIAAGARLHAETPVRHLQRANGGWKVHTESGDTIHAERVVLAAGAVGTPLILQRSGLGGAAVGRFLRLHPTSSVGGLFTGEVYAGAGIPQSAYCDHFHQENGGYGFWIEGPPVQPALASMALPGFGAAHRGLMERFRHLGVLIALVRDGADRSRSSGKVWEGRNGRLHIQYRPAPAERAMLRRAIASSLELLLAAGAREAFSLHTGMPRVRGMDDIAAIEELPDGPNQLALFSAHVNGTARMGTDPATSVCTPDGAVRGAGGLYVVDGSAMPTAPGVNPQLTIMSMATVIAERMG